MLSLSARMRKEIGKKVKFLRKRGSLPAILYGPKIENLNLEINSKEFERVYQEAGESSLIKLEITPKDKPTGQENEKKLKINEFLVLIQEIQREALTEKLTHVDFYQPSLKEEIEAKVPLIFKGESKAVKELGGTLVKNITELEVKALPQNLPHQIEVNVESLRTFEDNVLIKDLKMPEQVKTLRDPEEIVAQVAPPTKVEEELVKPIEEKVEEVKQAERKRLNKEAKEGEGKPR